MKMFQESAPRDSAVFLAPERYFRFLLVSLALWGGPAFFFWTGAGFFLQRTVENMTEGCFDRIEEVLARVEEGLDIEDALTPLIDGELSRKRLLGTRADPALVRSICSDFLASFPPGLFSVTLFDGNGRVPGAPPGSGPLAAELLFREIRRNFDEKMQLTEEEARVLEAVFPDYKRKIGFLKGRPGRVHLLPEQDPCIAGYFLFEPGGAGEVGGLLVFVRRESRLETLLMKRSLERVSRGEVHLLSRFHGSFQGSFPTGFSNDSLASLMERFRIEPGNRFFHCGFQAVVMSLERGDFILGLSPVAVFSPWRLGVILGVFAIPSFVFLLFIYRATLNGWSIPVPLRKKLVGFLLLVFGVPALFTMFWGLSFLAEEEGMFVKRHSQKMFDALAALDNGFDSFFLKRSLDYRKSAFAWRSLFSRPEAFREEMARLRRNRICDLPILVSSGGEVLHPPRFFDPDEDLASWLESRPRDYRRQWVEAHIDRIPRAATEGFGRFTFSIEVEDFRDLFSSKGELPAFGQWRQKASLRGELTNEKLRAFYKAIARSTFLSDGFRSPEPPPQKGPASASDLVMDSFMEDFDFALRRVRLSLGSFLRIGALNRDDFIYVDLFSDETGKPDYFFFGAHYSRNVEGEYLAPLIAGRSGLHPSVRLNAISLFPMVDNIPGMSDYRRFLSVFRSLSRGSSEFYQVIPGESGMELLTARRCRNLVHCILVARTPMEIVLEPFHSLKRKLAQAGFALLLFGAGLALLLYWRFIHPVEELRNGVGAMQRKEFGHRLIPLAGDELGKLCLAFNQALERLGDMELARQIQQEILPPGSLEIGPWEIAGANHMMQAVGGDFYDFFPISEKHLALAFGDVSGHGISAGLVTAMAKVGIRQFARESGDNPEEVLRRLNGLFLTVLQKKKMMTMVFGILDMEKGTLSLANAGQCSPFRLSMGSGEPSFLSLPSTPLGIVGKVKLASATIPIPGESLIVIYSDGLIECRDQAGKPFGLDHLAKAIKECQEAGGNPPLPDLVDSILGRVARFVGSSEQDDDRTILVIRRRASS